MGLIIKSSLYEYLLKELTKKINDQDQKDKEQIKKVKIQNTLAIIMVVLEIIGLLLISFSFILLIYDIGVKQTAKFMQLFINWENQIFSWGIVILGLSIIPAFLQSKTPKIEINRAKLFNYN